MHDLSIFHQSIEFISQWQKNNIQREDVIQLFLSDPSKHYALGRNENTLLLSKDVGLAGIVDDFISEPSEWHGIPVIPRKALPKNSILVNTVAVARPVSAEKRVRLEGEGRWLNHSDLYRTHPDKFSLPDFVKSSRDALNHNGQDFHNLFLHLNDEISKKTFLDIIKYRLTGCPAFMESYAFRINDQYFESFFKFPENGSFIDAGGFNGETSIEFAKRYPNYGSIHIFEPSEKNYDQIVKISHNIQRSHIHKMGLSDKKESLFFSGDAGSASKIDVNGSDEILVDTLDSFNIDRIDFIKMDLEGWELKALNGSKEAILKNHPILAISAYHHPLDFISIHDFILSIRSDYDVYLRHYTEGWTESVVYFIPRNN